MAVTWGSSAFVTAGAMLQDVGWAFVMAIIAGEEGVEAKATCAHTPRLSGRGGREEEHPLEHPV